MYKIIKKDFREKDYGKEEFLKSWPMLYVLENGKEAYVGESTSIINRMNQHKASVEKQNFETAHFIYSKEFNKSVTYDYESKLIQLLAADDNFIIMNRNAGIADKEYFNKEYYDQKFLNLWDYLRTSNLARHTINEIKNSDLFKYSPYKELNESQMDAVNEIFSAIKMDSKTPIVINGMPGSGKTIVAIYLFKFLKDFTDENGEQTFKNKKMALVVPQTSLRKTIKNLFKHIYGLKAAEVISPSEVAKQKYDIVLVDEAHRLHQRKNIQNYKAHDENNRLLGLSKESTELDWILKNVKCPVLFFDKNQIVGPYCITHEILKETIEKHHKRRVHTYFELTTQMRVKGGNEYLDYISSILNTSNNSKKKFEKYEFYLVDKFLDFENILYEKEKQKGLSRMVAGYAWPWISKNDKTLKDIEIEKSRRMWNNRTEDWINCETSIDEVGCIHSVQGYDLNYAFVIIGKDLKYDKEKNRIVIDPDSYFDKNGKNTAGYEELLQYIKNVYYVLMTRGIEGTYLYVCDEGLKEYLKGYVEVIK